MGDGKGLDEKNARVGMVGWEMVSGWMQRTRVWGWLDGRWLGVGSKELVVVVGCKEHAVGGGSMRDGRGFDAKKM